MLLKSDLDVQQPSLNWFHLHWETDIKLRKKVDKVKMIKTSHGVREMVTPVSNRDRRKLFTEIFMKWQHLFVQGPILFTFNVRNLEMLVMSLSVSPWPWQVFSALPDVFESFRSLLDGSTFKMLH